MVVGVSGWKSSRSGGMSGQWPPIVQFTKSDVLSVPGDATEHTIVFDGPGLEAGEPPQYDSDNLRSTVDHAYALLVQPAGSAVDITADTEGLWKVGAMAQYDDEDVTTQSAAFITIYVNDTKVDDAFQDDDWDGTQAHILTAGTLVIQPCFRELHAGDSVWMSTFLNDASVGNMEITDVVLTMEWIRPLLS